MPAEGRRHPSWDEISPFLETEDPTLHAIPGDPPVSIAIDPRGPRMGIRVPLTGEFNPPEPLAEVDIRQTSFRGKRHLEVSTANRALFPYFFALALSVADRVQVDGLDPRQAVDRSLEQWRALLRQASMLSEHEQTGLMGELWMLERLERSLGARALEAWTGPRGEAHDFRVGEQEFEIKTTRTERRVHFIAGLTQLVPSPGMSLYIVSLQFSAAGAAGGWTLRDRIRDVRGLFNSHGLAWDFDRLMLARYGITESNRDFYCERLQLRSDAYLVPVTEDMPRLVPEDILSIPRVEMERISDVKYRLDVAGLGFRDGSAEFLGVLPAGRRDV